MKNNIMPFSLRSDDKDIKIFKVKQYYTLTVEQYVKAKNRDEAFDIWLDHGGVINDKIDRYITQEKFDECETSFVDIDTPDTKVEYIGTVTRLSKDDPYELECNTDVPEVEDDNKVVPFNKTFGRHA
jgi:hypothetical protein